MKISSLQNPLVKQIIRLRNRRERNKSGLFLIEGYRELLRLSETVVTIPEKLLYCPPLFLGGNETMLLQAYETMGTQLIETSEQVFQKLSYRDRPDGLLALAPQMERSFNDLTLPENPLIVVAQAIEKPGNLGTILRSADASGVDLVIVCDRCTDLHNPNVVRASIGTLFTLPVLEASSKDTLSWLRSKNITVAAATPSAETLYTNADLTHPLAIAVGCEQLGLDATWMEQANLQLRIPMCGQADSLNVATATTLLLFETLRQRTL